MNTFEVIPFSYPSVKNSKRTLCLVSDSPPPHTSCSLVCFSPRGTLDSLDEKWGFNDIFFCSTKEHIFISLYYLIMKLKAHNFPSLTAIQTEGHHSGEGDR